MAHTNSVSNGVVPPLIDDNDEDDLEILEPSSSGQPSRKRGREEDEGEETMSELREKLRRLEKDYGEVKEKLSVFEKRSAKPSIPLPQIETHQIDVDCRNFLTSDDFRSPPVTVDGIEIRVRLREIVTYSSSLRTGERPEIAVTPYVTKTADDGPRSVLAFITIRQRSVCRKSKTNVYCEPTVNTLMDKPTEFVGLEEWFEPTDDLSHSSIYIRLTIVVQKTEMPGAGTDAKVVVVKGKDFFVSAAYLSQWSRYFRAYFEADMEENKTGIYPVKDDDISADDFQEMLLVIYPTQKPIAEDNFETLLRLANRFEMPDLTRRIEHYLIDFWGHSINRAFVFALASDTYELQLVQAKLLHRWTDAELLREELLTTDVYNTLTPATKNLVNQRYADASIRRSTPISNSRTCMYHDEDDEY